MSDPLLILYESLRGRLLNASTLWEDRVRPDYIPTTDARPVIVYSLVVGGDKHLINRHDPTFLVDVKIITSNQNKQQNAAQDAMVGAGLIADLIDNQGSQDVDRNGDATDRAMSGDDDWAITTVTQGMRIHIVDNWSQNGVAVYHSGHEYTITMEEV